jgi:hypothetical protein
MPGQGTIDPKELAFRYSLTEVMMEAGIPRYRYCKSILLSICVR